MNVFSDFEKKNSGTNVFASFAPYDEERKKEEEEREKEEERRRKLASDKASGDMATQPKYKDILERASGILQPAATPTRKDLGYDSQTKPDSTAITPAPENLRHPHFRPTVTPQKTATPQPEPVREDARNVFADHVSNTFQQNKRAADLRMLPQAEQKAAQEIGQDKYIKSRLLPFAEQLEKAELEAKKADPNYDTYYKEMENTPTYVLVMDRIGEAVRQLAFGDTAPVYTEYNKQLRNVPKPEGVTRTEIRGTDIKGEIIVGPDIYKTIGNTVYKNGKRVAEKNEIAAINSVADVIGVLTVLYAKYPGGGDFTQIGKTMSKASDIVSRKIPRIGETTMRITEGAYKAGLKLSPEAMEQYAKLGIANGILKSAARTAGYTTQIAAFQAATNSKPVKEALKDMATYAAYGFVMGAASGMVSAIPQIYMYHKLKALGVFTGAGKNYGATYSTDTRSSEVETFSLPQPLDKTKLLTQGFTETAKGIYTRNVSGLQQVIYEMTKKAGETMAVFQLAVPEKAVNKEKQFEVIVKSSPAPDEIKTWIRSVDDIKTYQEATAGITDNITPDYTSDMVKKALEEGNVTVYSSTPITAGAFVTPSKMEAQSYAGAEKVYSQKVPLEDVAWIDEVEGQFVGVSPAQPTPQPKVTPKAEQGVAVKKGDYVSIDGEGIGKVVHTSDSGISLELNGKEYYRAVDDTDYKVVTVDEYRNDIDRQINELKAEAKGYREQAATLNKESGGAAVARKGKIALAADGRPMGVSENMTSAEHRKLLEKAKELSAKANTLIEEKDKIPKPTPPPAKVTPKAEQGVDKRETTIDAIWGKTKKDFVDAENKRLLEAEMQEDYILEAVDSGKTFEVIAKELGISAEAVESTYVDSIEDTLADVDQYDPSYAHKKAVEAALKEGKSVPAKVLKDYPELTKVTPQAEQPATPVEPAAKVEPVKEPVKVEPEKTVTEPETPTEEVVEEVMYDKDSFGHTVTRSETSRNTLNKKAKAIYDIIAKSKNIKAADLMERFNVPPDKYVGLDYWQKVTILDKTLEGLRTEANNINIKIPKDGVLDFHNDIGTAAWILDRFGVKTSDMKVPADMERALKKSGKIVSFEKHGETYIVNGHMMMKVDAPTLAAVDNSYSTEVKEGFAEGLGGFFDVEKFDGNLIEAIPALNKGLTVKDMNGVPHKIQAYIFDDVTSDGTQLILNKDIVDVFNKNGNRFFVSLNPKESHVLVLGPSGAAATDVEGIIMKVKTKESIDTKTITETIKPVKSNFWSKEKKPPARKAKEPVKVEPVPQAKEPQPAKPEKAVKEIAKTLEIEATDVEAVGAQPLTAQALDKIVKDAGFKDINEAAKAMHIYSMTESEFTEKHPDLNYLEEQKKFDKIPKEERSSVKINLQLFSQYQFKIPKEYNEFKDMWFGNKDVAHLQHSVETAKFQDRIKAITKEKSYGKESKKLDTAIQVYIDLLPTKAMPNKAQDMIDKYEQMLSKEQKEIVDLSQNLPTEAKIIAREIIASDNAMGLKAMDHDIITNVLENHLSRFWEQEKKVPESKRKFGTKTGLAKQRKFESILEGWAKGKKLAINSATNSLNTMKDIIADAIENRRLMDAMLSIPNPDDPDKNMFSYHQENGYQQIEHPGFRKWVYATSVDLEEKPVVYNNLALNDKVKLRGEKDIGKVVGKSRVAGPYVDVDFKGTLLTVDANDLVKVIPRGTNFVITDDGTVLERKVIYAPAEIAKNLNNILGKSKLMDIWGIETITRFNAAIKATILQTSFFHHVAFSYSYLLGTHGKNLKELNPISAYKEGLKRAMALEPEVVLLVRNGLTLGKMQDWEEATLRKENPRFEEILKKIPAAKPIRDAIRKLRESQADFLFKEFGAGLKVKAALLEYNYTLKKFPNMEENKRARMVAGLINDDFGGLHLQRMGRNPTVQHIFRLIQLAPDWTESNIRTMIGTFKKFKNNPDEQTKFYRKFWSGVLSKGLAAWLLGNIVLSLMDDEYTFEERFKMAWETGNLRFLDWDITPIYKMLGGDTSTRKYLTTLGHFIDPIKFVVYPIRSARNKGSVLARFMLELLTGTDWKGWKFTTLDELFETGKIATYGTGSALKYVQIPSFLINTLKGWMPVQIQNAVSAIMGEMEVFDAITKSVGLRTSTTRDDPKKYSGNPDIDKFYSNFDVVKKEIKEYKDNDAKVPASVTAKYNSYTAANDYIKAVNKRIESTKNSSDSDEAKKRNIERDEKLIAERVKSVVSKN